MKKSQNGRNQCFAYYFCLMIEGSGSISLTDMDPDPGAKHKDPTDPDGSETLVPDPDSRDDCYLLAVVGALEVGEVEQLTHLPLHLRLAARLDQTIHNVGKEFKEKIRSKVSPFGQFWG
jgi:hypothetical protein